MKRTASPAQIRRQAAIAFRNRMRAAICDRVPGLRPPEPGETPLSPEEVTWGVAHGHIRTPRVIAQPSPATHRSA